MRLSYLILFLLCFVGTIDAYEIKVLTYNIYRKPEPFGLSGTHAKKRVKHLCHELMATDYDVIMLQEVWLAKDRKRLANCGYPYVMDVSSVDYYRPGRAAVHAREQNLESGLLILSKHPIVQKIKVDYANRGDWWNVFSDGETLASKSIYLAKISLPNALNIWFINTHLAANYCNFYPWRDCKSYEDIRFEQIKVLSQLISEKSGPIIFGGDLNMGPKLSSRDRVWDQFDQYFKGFSQAPYDPATSSTSSSTNMFKLYENGKIDHLFGSNDLVKSDGNVVFDQLLNIDGLSLHLSDHYGWETTFSFDL